MAASTSRARMGLGTKLVWAESQFSAEIIEQIEGFGAERADFDATHMGVPPLQPGDFANGLKVPSEIARLSDATYMIHLDSANAVPPLNNEETVELEFRRRKTELTPAKFSATGWLKSFTWTIPVEGKMTARIVMAFTGNAKYIKPTLIGS